MGRFKLRRLLRRAVEGLGGGEEKDIEEEPLEEIKIKGELKGTLEAGDLELKDLKIGEIKGAKADTITLSASTINLDTAPAVPTVPSLVSEVKAELPFDVAEGQEKGTTVVLKGSGPVFIGTLPSQGVLPGQIRQGVVPQDVAAQGREAPQESLMEIAGMEESRGVGIISVTPALAVEEIRPLPVEVLSHPRDVLSQLVHTLPEDIAGEFPAEWKPPSYSDVDERYPLIPPHAYAHIVWHDEENKLVYHVEEPVLTLHEKEELDRIKTLLTELIDVGAYEIEEPESIERYVEKKFDEIVRDYGFNLTPLQYEKFKYYILRDFVGLERIEPLMKDPKIEDISCIGPGIPIYVYHRKYGSVQTDVMFKDNEELNRFIIKMAQLAGRHVSVSDPLLQGALPDGSRVQATYVVSKDISTRGSNFTIRKFRKDPLTITDLVKYGTLTPTIAAYLWLAVQYRSSILIAGGTATGKTTLLNAIAMFIPPEAKIVSIEDTPELRLSHENWLQKIAREEEGVSKVDLFDLLRAALRERPDYIVVGEVRGKETYVLFQGMATGHPGLATIHAENMDTLVDRLISPPISLPPALLHSLDLVIFARRALVKNYRVRRIGRVEEIMDVDLERKRPITNTFIEWIPAEDKFVIAKKSKVIDKIIHERGVDEKSVWSELRRRSFVIKYLADNDIRYYRDVQKYISRYYKEPDVLLEEIGYAK